MKKHTIFELSIIGFFISIIVSTYLMSLISTDTSFSQILNFISLVPLLDMIPLAGNNIWYVSFFFFVFVYTIYGFIFACLINKFSKSKFIILPLILVLVILVFLQQKDIHPKVPQIQDDSYFQMASVIRSIKNSPKQYFGQNEVFGDINGDSLDDVVFVLNRNDEQRGFLYYLSSALATSSGHVGTNLIFLGNKIEPKKIMVENGIINLEYIDHSINNSTTTDTMHIHLIDGELNYASSTIQ